MRAAPDIKGVALIAVSAASFATLGVFGKLAYAEGLDLASALFWRFAGAALALGLWLGLAGRGRITPRGALLAFLLGAIGYATQAALFFAALQHAGASVVALLLYLYPAFVVLLAWLVERDRPDRLRLTALAAALAGSALTADLAGGQIAPLGVTLGVGAAVWYSFYLTFGARLVRTHDPVVTTALISTGATITFALAATLSGGLMAPVTLPGWAALAGMAIIATALPIGALFAGIARLGTPTAAILSTLEPVIAVALGIALLGEVLNPRQVLGAALVLAAALALQRWSAAPTTPAAAAK